MKTHVQIALLLLASVYGLWTVGFVAAPRQVHALLSAAAYDPATLAMLTAAMLALVVSFMLTASNPVREMVLSACHCCLHVRRCDSRDVAQRERHDLGLCHSDDHDCQSCGRFISVFVADRYHGATGYGKTQGGAAQSGEGGVDLEQGRS